MSTANNVANVSGKIGDFETVLDLKECGADREKFKAGLLEISNKPRNKVLLRNLDDDTITWLASDDGISYLKYIEAKHIRLHYECGDYGVPVTFFSWGTQWDHSIPTSPFKVCAAELIGLYASDYMKIRVK